MKYVKAQDVLPEELIELIQKYIDGKSWGESTGIKNILKIRNREIYIKYKNGMSVDALSKEYYLSEKSIRRIINLQKKICS